MIPYLLNNSLLTPIPLCAVQGLRFDTANPTCPLIYHSNIADIDRVENDDKKANHTDPTPISSTTSNTNPAASVQFVDESSSGLNHTDSKAIQPTSTKNPAAAAASVQVVDRSTGSQSSPSTSSIDTSKYPPSCIVRLSAGVSAGGQLTIRWPTIDQIGSAQDGNNRASKRLRTDDSPNNANSDLLVRVTLPSTMKFKNNGSTLHVKVFAPWVTAQHAAANTLTTRQLRSIGIDGHDSCNINLRRSRQQHIRIHGEGHFSEGHSRIGSRYQVTNIPSSATWANDQLSNDATAPHNEEATAKYDQIWDATHSEEAYSQGEHIYQYIDTLHSFQKAQGMMTLHQSGYKVSLSERIFTSQATAGIALPNTTELATVQACQYSQTQTMLEGNPFTLQEQDTFHEAFGEHRKHWPKIAQAVGTSVNRCLVYYYSTYKAGKERDAYLTNKKLWEQSDECVVCHDGGDLLCCDGCINSYHMNCITPTMNEVPAGDWLCPECEDKRKA